MYYNKNIFYLIMSTMYILLGILFNQLIMLPTWKTEDILH